MRWILRCLPATLGPVSGIDEVILGDLLRPARILVPFTATTREEAIPQLVRCLVEEGGVRADRSEEFAEALWRREARASTGMERGVALPHAVLEGLEQVHGILAISKTGIEWDSFDGESARLVLLLALPPSRYQQHVHTLAGIARLLNDPRLRQALLQAPDASSAHETLLETERGTGLDHSIWARRDRG